MAHGIQKPSQIAVGKNSHSKQSKWTPGQARGDSTLVIPGQARGDSTLVIPGQARCDSTLVIPGQARCDSTLVIPGLTRNPFLFDRAALNINAIYAVNCSHQL